MVLVSLATKYNQSRTIHLITYKFFPSVFQINFKCNWDVQWEPTYCVQCAVSYCLKEKVFTLLNAGGPCSTYEKFDLASPGMCWNNEKNKKISRFSLSKFDELKITSKININTFKKLCKNCKPLVVRNKFRSRSFVVRPPYLKKKFQLQQPPLFDICVQESFLRFVVRGSVDRLLTL